MVKQKKTAVLAVTPGLMLLFGFAPLAARAAMVNGTVTGKTVSMPGPDFTDTATTINVTYFTSCYFISNGIEAQDFDDMNFVFAGQGVASGISSISPSDFTISQ